MITGQQLSLLALCGSLISLPISADTLRIGVASNFSGTFSKLESDFESRSSHRLTELSASSGKLYAQIVHGAPIDVFLAADSERPSRLEESGYAIDGSRFTYAVGQLALWSAKPQLVVTQDSLRLETFHYLAIANPHVAPYGKAAIDVIGQLGLRGKLSTGIVRGENVSQAMHYVASGNADFGFISLSQAKSVRGSYWQVPTTLHQPILQQAIVVVESDAANEFVAYLRSDEARAVITASGYLVP